MGFIEIKQSGPDIPDGVYPVILTAINGDPQDPNLPRHVVPTQGPNADKDLYFWDWKFAIDQPGHPLDGIEIEYGTSTATSPRSKMYGLLTALFNGSRPPVGTVIERTHVIGRRALATIQRDETGYCRITNLSAMPTGMQQQSFAAATGAPVAQQSAPVAQPAVAAPTVAQPPAVTQPGWQAPIQQIVPPQPVAAAPVAAPAGEPAPDAQLPF